MDDYDLWTFPKNLTCPDELPTVVHFKLDPPSLALEINEEEFFEQINCDKKIVKNAMFSLCEKQLQCEVNGKITVTKTECPGKSVTIGCYKIPNLKCVLKALMDQYDKKADDNQSASSGCVKELVQLNCDGQPSGSLYYTLRMTCFGPTINTNQDGKLKSKRKQKKEEDFCLYSAADPSPCPSESNVARKECDEYSAEINGNQLIVRINKDDTSRLVTRVYDSNMDQCGNEIKRDKNTVSVYGCDQQIDFKFPQSFSCGDCKTSSKPFSCGPSSILTEYQRRTSCYGKTFKNSCALPAIRGNLKYPGRFDGGSINFDLFDKCNPRDATEYYKRKPSETRGACMQVDAGNICREQQGKCKLPRGIEVCRRGCYDPDTDVFILKIGKKNTNKVGRQSAIELEMRTPKAPDAEIKKMETREVQVDEKEFCHKKADAAKNEAVPVKPKVSTKTVSKIAVVPKGFEKKKQQFCCATKKSK